MSPPLHLSLLCAAGAAISWLSDVGNEVWERLGDSSQPVIQLAVVWCLAHSRFLIINEHIAPDVTDSTGSLD